MLISISATVLGVVGIVSQQLGYNVALDFVDDGILLIQEHYEQRKAWRLANNENLNKDDGEKQMFELFQTNSNNSTGMWIVTNGSATIQTNSLPLSDNYSKRLDDVESQELVATDPDKTKDNANNDDSTIPSINELEDNQGFKNMSTVDDENSEENSQICESGIGAKLYEVETYEYETEVADNDIHDETNNEEEIEVAIKSDDAPTERNIDSFMAETLNQNVTFACSQCGLDIDTEICTHIDGKEDPESVNKIIKGELFLRTCKKCGKINVVAFPVGYKDKTTGRYIFFLPISSTLKFKDPDVPESSRITRDIADFTEKVRIMQMGMDDKIIEIVKIAALDQVVKDGKLSVDNLVSIGCWVNDDKSLDLDLRCDDKQYILQATYKMYQDVEAEFGEILKQYQEPKVVDSNWAIMFLNSLTIEANQINHTVNDDDWDEIVFE